MIIMITKGRSSTTRHVSRTHRLALDWLFDRINLDPTIQIKYVDTKNQFAAMLTKGNFTRDEWNHLLRLFIIMFFFHCFPAAISILSRSREPCRTELRKGGPEKNLWCQNREELVVSRNLSAKQSASMDSGCFIRPGESRFGSEFCFRKHWETSAGQGPEPSEWQRDDNPFSSTGKLVRSGLCERSSTGKSARGIENQLARKKLDYHNMQISDNQYTEKVFKNLRKKLNLSKSEHLRSMSVLLQATPSRLRVCDPTNSSDCYLLTMQRLRTTQLRRASHDAPVPAGTPTG